MNAKKFHKKHKVESNSADLIVPLKFLSGFQKRKSNALAQDWMAFTDGIFGEIINKI